MQQFVKEYIIDLLLVDIKTNEDRLSISLARYTHIIHEPTHLGGGLLDHFYVKENFLSGNNMHSLVVNVYFSDHDAVQVIFSAR